jgi:predicted DNA-binding transcriptional regulator AlpA
MGRAMTVRLLSHDALAERFGLRWSRRWIRQLVREGRFPQPVMLLGRVAWREDEVTAWIDQLPRATGRVPTVFTKAAPTAEPAPIAAVVPLPRRRIRRRRPANSEAARAEAAWRGTLALMA